MVSIAVVFLLFYIVVLPGTWANLLFCVGRHGIRVNVVAPGLVETEMGRRLAKWAMRVDDISSLHEKSPFGRVCQPEDVASVVRFLVSEGAAYMTGEKLNVHGGGS